MQPTNEVQLILLIAAVALTLGLLSGFMGWSLFFGALVWIIIQYGQHERFRQWARHPLRVPPNLNEAWYRLAAIPYRQLGRERQRTRAILGRMRDIVGVTELIPDAVILLDETGAIESMNSAARKLFNLKKEDVGLGLANIVRSPDFAEFLRSEEAENAPLEFSSPLDPEQQLEARSFISETQSKLILVRDITSSNRLLTMRQQFVANVSHELRTPLTVVSGYLETINDESASDELRLQLVDKFTKPMNRMQSLVEDLLLLTQLESSTARPELREVLMSSVIRGAVDELQTLQTAPGQITARVESSRRILGSEKELHSVCVNLLSNALRHSGAQSIEISWRDHGDSVQLSVADDGCGIPTEYLNRLTERFFRVDVVGAQTRVGTGLGLAIVKHVLKRHDSALQIESALNTGSRFSCEFMAVADEKNTVHMETELGTQPSPISSGDARPS